MAAEDHPGALNGVSLTIAEGEFVAVIGPNGSGKSTLGRCMNGLIHPHEGAVMVDGMDTSVAERRWDVFRTVGMIFQNPDNQLVATTAEREIAFGLENLGVPTPEMRERVSGMLEDMELAPFRLYPPHRLSGGQKQRLAVAAVTAMYPRYLVCDEPTSLLDPLHRSEMLDLLFRLRVERGIGVVYITQFPEEAARADRLVIMRGGEIVEEDVPDRVFQDAERLRGLGLDVPLTRKLAVEIQRRGVDMPMDTLQPDALVAAIVERYRNGRSPMASENAPAAPDHPKKTPSRITLKDVCHTYQPGTILAAHALAGVSLEIGAGECVALIGPNGSGKSTLIQCLNGLLTPESGSVCIDEKNLADRSTDLRLIRRQVGLIFQFPEAQLFEETVFDDVAFGPRQTGVPESEIPERVAQALTLVELAPERYQKRHPLSLSGGERRRAAIAGVLAMRPAILAVDEPTAGLDPRSAGQIESILQTFHTEGGTLILISHDMDLVARLADRVILLGAGRILTDDTPERVFSQDEWRHSGALPELERLLSELRSAGLPAPYCRSVEQAAEQIVSLIHRE